MNNLITILFSTCLLNIPLLTHYVEYKNINSRIEFFKKNVQEKQFSTLYNLIKDKKYRAQKECFLRGNCPEHPMDEFINTMRAHAIDMKTFGEKVLKEQEKKSYCVFAKINNFQQQEIKNAKQKADARVNESKKRSLNLKPTIIVDAAARTYLIDGHLDRIRNLYKKHNLSFSLTVIVSELPYRAAVSISADRTMLKLAPSFFQLSTDMQEAILNHEFTHLNFFDPLFVLYFSQETNCSQEKIKNSSINHFFEFRADQLTAFADLYAAESMKKYLILLTQQIPSYKMPTTHPNNIDRYNDLKVIVQLHKTYARSRKKLHHPRYTQEKYEKYVVGYEKAWDKWCDQQQKK